MDNKPFQKNPRYLFLNVRIVDVCKKDECHAREKVGMRVGVAELVGNCVKHMIPAFRVENLHHIHEDLHPVFCELTVSMQPHVVYYAPSDLKNNGVDKGNIDTA